MADYYLEASIPYEKPDILFYGSEEGLKKFINDNKGTKEYRWPTGRVTEHKTICGYRLDDLYVSIEGPDVKSYLED